MTTALTHIRKLTIDDFESLKKLDTGMEDDYVLYIFDKLVNSKDHVMYGLFDGEQMLTVAGYSIFANHFAMLGRIRSDRRFLGKGNATKLSNKMIEDIKQDPNIYWVGANTQEHNTPARKVLEKLGFHVHQHLYPLLLKSSHKVKGTTGPLWSKVHSRDEKLNLLKSILNTEMELFPFECYYNFPVSEHLFTEAYIDQSSIYINEDHSRFFIMKEDQKGELYTHVVYPWNDHFEQPGFWDSVMDNLHHTFTNHRLWIDFTKESINNSPALDDFEVKDPWLLHGYWVK